MPPKLRRSLVVRLIALGFIYLIVLGNIWFIQLFTEKVTPLWMQLAFLIGVAWVGILGVCLGIYGTYLWKTGALQEDEDDDTESENRV
ncbi:hypothetical protein [Pseudobacteriovorax antillogorgiicola]|uniref:Uncharacterized protein n=1 Tax=Pseudobacteriovorax antillogorgiicola TaxID=1513793 RepID=A0A1Y6B496_9BACT|nr:hypothetical protein [Pseudobacteriovorax antillogorgiicola]TCS59402.1 hypothetical protein EDD56_101312 [Pseudobacteriovorax antillogorgiicola]SME88630.1 hypothetical protein SAMN06296036_101173 [Pseudobacteriovorax antillogorgiicola]